MRTRDTADRAAEDSRANACEMADLLCIGYGDQQRVSPMLRIALQDLAGERPFMEVAELAEVWEAVDMLRGTFGYATPRDRFEHQLQNRLIGVLTTLDRFGTTWAAVRSAVNTNPQFPLRTFAAWAVGEVDGKVLLADVPALLAAGMARDHWYIDAGPRMTTDAGEAALALWDPDSGGPLETFRAAAAAAQKLIDT